MQKYKTHLLSTKSPINMKAAEGICLYTMHTGSRKTIQRFHGICCKTLEHTNINDTNTPANMFTLRSRREVRQNIVIQAVSYKATKKSLFIPSQ